MIKNSGDKLPDASHAKYKAGDKVAFSTGLSEFTGAIIRHEWYVLADDCDGQGQASNGTEWDLLYEIACNDGKMRFAAEDWLKSELPITLKSDTIGEKPQVPTSETQ